MKVPFDIKYKDDIYAGIMHVITRDGKWARIICWDMKNDFPIVAVVTYQDGREGSPELYTTAGTNATGNTALDLFVELPHPQLSDFEAELASIFFKREYAGSMEDLGAVDEAVVKYEYEAAELAPNLLLLAQEEFEKGLPHWRHLPPTIVSYPECEFGIMELSCLADSSSLGNDGSATERTISVLHKGNYYIPIHELAKLPKQE